MFKQLNGHKLPLVVFILVALLLSTVACQRKNTVCPPDSITYTQNGTLQMSLSAPEISSEPPTPAPVDIGGRTRLFDKVVRGDFCKDDWSGAIYVACDVEVARWEEEPTFLDGCSLSITDGTVVVVAAHNNETFYKGCSCHYTEPGLP